MGLSEAIYPGFAGLRVIEDERDVLRAVGTYGPERTPATALVLPATLPEALSRRAVDEAQRATALQHPRLTPVLAAGIQAGRATLICARPGGVPATRMWGNPLAPPFVCSLGLDVLSALTAGAALDLHHGQLSSGHIAIEAGQATLVGLGSYFFERFANGCLDAEPATAAQDAEALHRVLAAALAPDARHLLGPSPSGEDPLSALGKQLGVFSIDDELIGDEPAPEPTPELPPEPTPTPEPAPAPAPPQASDPPSTIPVAPPSPTVAVNILSGGPAQEPVGRQPRIGDVVGKCLLVEQLGAGATSVVFLALHSTLNTQVAVKIIAEADQMSRNEAQILARLRHPNIVGIFDYEEREGYSYLLLEYVKGATLHEVIAQGGAIQPKRAIAIAREITMALSYAEGQGVLHRDLKPANVLIDGKGQARLADLGLASSRQLGDPLAGTDAIVGTPGYVSPEQIDGREPDLRSDIYSLGATLYTALAGQPPFAGPPLTVLIAQQESDPAPLDTLRPELPEAICHFIESLMQRDPAQRPQSYDEVLEALQRLESELDPPPADARSLTSRVLRQLRYER